MYTPKFATAVSCIDGRVQMPVIRYLKNRYAVDYVDVISEPGADLILANATDKHTVEAILRKIRTSLVRHESRLVAVVGHYDCSGNPAPREVQEQHIRTALERLKAVFLQDVRFVGLWVNQRWTVQDVPIVPKNILPLVTSNAPPRKAHAHGRRS